MPIEKQHPYYRLHWLLNWAANRLMLGEAASKWLRWLFWGGAATIPTLFAVLQFCDTHEQALPGWSQELVAGIHHHRLTISVVFAGAQLIFGVMVAVTSWLRPFDFERARPILERAVQTHFTGMKPLEHEYRATVFKIRGWRSLGGQWLGIVCRSGETYDRSGTIFFVDRMAPARSTGLGGKCFAAQGATVIPQSLLPVGDQGQRALWGGWGAWGLAP